MSIGVMRDSSRDYRTYWLRGGQYYSRMRNLGDASPCALPPDKVAQIPEADRKVVVLEASSDPAFCAKLAKVMTTDPDWVHTISNSAKRAIANELDPKVFPGSRGTWPKLRELSRTVVGQIAAAVAKSGNPVVAAKAVAGLGGLGDLGQWDIIASLVGSIGTAAVNVYGAGVTSRAQVDAQRDQANAAIAIAQAQMNAQNAAAAMQAANAAANPLSAAANSVSSAVSAITSATVAGVPVLALAIPAIGIIIYLATKK